jgi:hypothetical protein
MAKAVSQSKASSREASITTPADDDVIDGGAGPGAQASSGADSPDTPVNVEGAQNGGAPSADLVAAITAAGGGVTTGTSSSSDFDGGAAP